MPAGRRLITRAPWALPAAALGALALAPSGAADLLVVFSRPLVGLVVFASCAFLAWHVHPAYTLSAGIFLTPLAGNWPALGVPGPLSPDRLLLVGAVAAVLLRAPPIADRPPLRPTGAHWLLGLAAVYALASAVIAGTFLERDGFIKIFDTFGILPFLTFLVAPVVFRTPAERRVLLGTLVLLGSYLSFTVLFDMVGADALVFPRYILDPNYGMHPDRGRGPFVDPVACGLALYTCAVACVIAVATWRTTAMRALALAVAMLSIVGTFLCLERSVWIGAGVGTAVAMLAIPRLRLYFIPAVAAVAVAVGASLALIPGLSDKVLHRVDDPTALWDRKNLDRAGLKMVEARPLFGFGWSTFADNSGDYFVQASDYPLTASGVDRRNRRFGLHNTPLTYAVELGLIGLTPWLLGLLFGVGGALATRGPPDLQRWRAGLLAVAIAFLVVINAVPPSAWQNRSLWLLAGLVLAGRYAVTGAAR
jgi:putative inorganic carbon (hco3(-)) transporter